MKIETERLELIVLSLQQLKLWTNDIAKLEKELGARYKACLLYTSIFGLVIISINIIKMIIDINKLGFHNIEIITYIVIIITTILFVYGSYNNASAVNFFSNTNQEFLDNINEAKLKQDQLIDEVMNINNTIDTNMEEVLDLSLIHI